VSSPPTAFVRWRGGGAALGRFKSALRRAAHRAVAPVVGGLAAIGVRPDHVTVLGLVMSAGAGLAFFEGAFRWGAVYAAVAGICDVLDGELARRRDEFSKFGAFLDSTLDRLSEGLILLGIAGFYVVHLVELSFDPSLVMAEVSRGLEPRTWAVVALTAMLALVMSLLVSYTRARAEGLGLECRVGWFERPERLALLIVAGAFGVSRVMPAALLLLVALSAVTVAQRIRHVWEITRGAGLDR